MIDFVQPDSSKPLQFSPPGGVIGDQLYIVASNVHREVKVGVRSRLTSRVASKDVERLDCWFCAGPTSESVGEGGKTSHGVDEFTLIVLLAPG